jgi:hypothetical protein
MRSKPTNIRGRLEALEQAHKRAFHSVCEICGGPKPGDNTDTHVNEKGEPMWGVCPACGLWLNEEGKVPDAIPLAPGQRRCVPEPWGPGMPWD